MAGLRSVRTPCWMLIRSISPSDYYYSDTIFVITNLWLLGQAISGSLKNPFLHLYLAYPSWKSWVLLFSLLLLSIRRHVSISIHHYRLVFFIFIYLLILQNIYFLGTQVFVSCKNGRGCNVLMRRSRNYANQNCDVIVRPKKVVSMQICANSVFPNIIFKSLEFRGLVCTVALTAWWVFIGPTTNWFSHGIFLKKPRDIQCTFQRYQLVKEPTNL